jgi:hypothetical protein
MGGEFLPNKSLKSGPRNRYAVFVALYLLRYV